MHDLDIREIPELLRPFAPWVEKWMLTREPQLERLQRAEADAAAMGELERAAQLWSHAHQVALEDWTEAEDPPSAAARLYGTFISFLGELELDLNEGPSDWVGLWIEWLTALGSRLKAARRAQAAGWLADYGSEGRRALPALHAALDDEHLPVRVWAGFALARLEGAVQRYRPAIESIGRTYGPDDSRLSAAVRGALQRLGWTDRQHALAGLCRFAGRGDLENMQRLLAQTDINGRDQAGATPLQHAVGARRTLAVEWLLMHGADPNLATASGDTPLHWAAASRVGAPMVELLLRHGADAKACNERGQTPLDRAVEFGRAASAGLLRAAAGTAP
jgi:hypothetical protein